MDIQAEKIALAQLLLQTENTSVILAIKKIFKSEEKDFWNDLTTEQKDAIELGIEEANSGKVVDFDSMIQKYM